MMLTLLVFGAWISLVSVGGKPVYLKYIPHQHPLEKLRPFENVKVDTDCILCETTIAVAKAIVASGVPSEETVVELLSKLCDLFGIEDGKVCSKVIPEFKDEFFYILANLTMPVSKACSILLSQCDTDTDPFQDWNVTLPDTPKPPVLEPKSPPALAPKTRILQLSDIHVDFYYEIGSNADCGEPLCCTKGDGPAPTADKAAGKWGDYRSCDTPYWTLENLLDHLAKKEKFDYIYWTGDLPSHHIWDQTREQQVDIYKNVTKLLLQYFPNTKIFSALGNHESAPVNSFPQPFVTDGHSITWLYDEMADSWTNWIPKNLTSTIKVGGFYTTLIEPGLRIISMNTNYCSTENWWLLLNTTDPAKELQWLVRVLQYAEDNGEKVHIIGHIPPGENCIKAWSWNYYKIINRYESTVAAQMFGHTHKDHYEVFYDERDQTRATNIVFVSPSVTPYSYINPSYRIYTVDGNHKYTNRMVLDHETYILNLTQANLYDKPVWEFEYSAKDAYKLPNVFPSEWGKLVDRMTKDEALWNKFYYLFYKSHPTSQCTGQCKTNMLCKLKSGRSRDKTFCKGL